MSSPQGEFAANIDVGRVGFDRVSSNENTLKQDVGIPLNERPILEGSGFTLISVTTEIDGFGRVFGKKSPLHTGDESGSPTTAEVRGLDLLGDLLGFERRQRLTRGLVAAMGKIDVELTNVRNIEMAQEHLFSHQLYLISH